MEIHAETTPASWQADFLFNFNSSSTFVFTNECVVGDSDLTCTNQPVNALSTASFTNNQLTQSGQSLETAGYIL
jgi:hypothetical protein